MTSTTHDAEIFVGDRVTYRGLRFSGAPYRVTELESGVATIEPIEDEGPAHSLPVLDLELSLPRQFCRGHLERGESFTVGTLPSGRTRRYWTAVEADKRRFHYCAACLELATLEPIRERLEKAGFRSWLENERLYVDGKLAIEVGPGQNLEQIRAELLELLPAIDLVVVTDPTEEQISRALELTSPEKVRILSPSWGFLELAFAPLHEREAKRDLEVIDLVAQIHDDPELREAVEFGQEIRVLSGSLEAMAVAALEAAKPISGTGARIELATVRSIEEVRS